jgi:chemotaxis protein MotB
MDIKQEEEKKPRRRVKKKKGHGGHHGGAWKVAYADFVTAMMALFLVLWLVSQADTKLKQSIANYFRSPGVFDTMQGGILASAKKLTKEPGNLTSKDDEQALNSVAQTLQKQFSTRPEFSKYKDQVKVEVTEEGLRIQLLDKAERVSFPNGSAQLTPEAEQVLKEIAESICVLPNKINISGHTDSRVFPSETGYTNWELSADRANAARRVLEAGCVKPGQIRRIVGLADTEPMDPDPYAPANRRISITVLRLAAPASPNTLGTNDMPPEKDIEKPRSNVVQPVLSEKKLAKEKLKTEGAVVVGEADPVPDKPRLK